MRIETVGIALALLGLAGPGNAQTFGVRMGGASVAPWEALDEAGNAMGLGLTLDMGLYQAALAFATVLPDSRSDGRFDAWWAEGQFHPFRNSGWSRRLSLSPHVLLGVGVVTADEPPDSPLVTPVRWVTRGPQILGLSGLGVTYGGPTGLSISMDFRAYNHTHGGLGLQGMWRF